MFLYVRFLVAHHNKRELVCFEISRNREPALQEMVESYCLKSLYRVHWQRMKKPDVVQLEGQRECCSLQPDFGDRTEKYKYTASYTMGQRGKPLLALCDCVNEIGLDPQGKQIIKIIENYIRLIMDTMKTAYLPPGTKYVEVNLPRHYSHCQQVGEPSERYGIPSEK